jgi:hypothetical protein
MYPDAQRLEDISSIRDAMRQISLEAQAVVELLDVRMEDTHLEQFSKWMVPLVATRRVPSLLY